MSAPDFQKYAPRIIALLIALGGTLLLTWQGRQLYLQMTSLPATTGKAVAAAPVDPQRLQQLFGMPASGGVRNLDGVLLQGCVVAPDPRHSHALVRVEGQGAVAVFTDEELLPGVVVRQIAHDHVLLDRNGAPLRLEFSAGTEVSKGQPG